MKYFLLLFFSFLFSCNTNTNPIAKNETTKDSVIWRDTFIMSEFLKEHHLTVKNPKVVITNFTDESGEKDGWWITYDSLNHHKITDAQYQHNVLHGTYVSYYENGKKKEEGKYVRGLKEGDWKTYDEDGDIDNTETFKNDKSVVIEVHLK